MSTKGERVVELLRVIASAETELRTLIDSTTRREIGADLGEWLGSQILGCTKAASSTQKHWDLASGSGSKIQVRTNRKAPTNMYRGKFFLSHKEMVAPDGADQFLLIGMNADRTAKGIFLIDKSKVPSVGKQKKDGWELDSIRLEQFKLQPSDPRVKDAALLGLILGVGPDLPPN